jgi:hypothetical protein
MSPANTPELQRLCYAIQTLVTGRDLDLSYNQGGVRITVLSGTKAQAEGDFIKAMSTYLSAKQFMASAQEGERATGAFLQALDKYTKAMGYESGDLQSDRTPAAVVAPEQPTPQPDPPATDPRDR